MSWRTIRFSFPVGGIVKLVILWCIIEVNLYYRDQPIVWRHNLQDFNVFWATTLKSKMLTNYFWFFITKNNNDNNNCNNNDNNDDDGVGNDNENNNTMNKLISISLYLKLLATVEVKISDHNGVSLFVRLSRCSSEYEMCIRMSVRIKMNKLFYDIS